MKKGLIILGVLVGFVLSIMMATGVFAQKDVVSLMFLMAR